MHVPTRIVGADVETWRAPVTHSRIRAVANFRATPREIHSNDRGTERDRGAELQMYVVEEPKVRHFPHGRGELVLGRLGDEVVLDFVEDGQRERALERDRARRARLDELAVEGLELVIRRALL